jgi:hypothetical protein
MNRREKDLQMMRAPQSWPRKNLLCLKRYINLQKSGAMERIEFANLHFLPKDSTWVFWPEGGESKEGKMEMLEQLIQEGWMVD